MTRRRGKGGSGAGFQIIIFLLQDLPACSSQGRTCYENIDPWDESCPEKCDGLHADVNLNIDIISNKTKDYLVLERLRQAYDKYKTSFVKNMFVDKDEKFSNDWSTRFKTTRKPYHALQLVQIYFDTATYDEIVKDVSVTLADQLGAIGGTMGLFAGFSFLSAVELLYFFVKYLLDLVPRKCSD